MILSEADALFATKSRIEALGKLIADEKLRRIDLSGLAGSAPALLFAALPQLKQPLLIVAADITDAGYLYNDLRNITDDEAVAVFPSGYKRGIKYGQQDPPSQILRTDTLERLSSSKKLRFVITCPEALAEKVAPRKTLASQTISLKVGQKIPMSEIVAELIKLGFNSVEYVYEPGQFARRGSILDVYSYSAELPWRLDFFDTEIDSIRAFNVESQLSDHKVDSVAIVPRGASESTEGVSLLEFMGSHTVVASPDPGDIAPAVANIASQEFSKSALIAEEGDPDAMKKVVDADNFLKTITGLRWIRFGVQPAPAGFNAEASLSFNTTLQSLYHKNFDLISESFTRFIADGYKILLLSDSESQANRLREIFKDRGDNISFTPVQPTLHEGFADHDAKICFFTDHQIFDRFHKYSLRSDKARAGKLAMSLKELNQIEIGDYIVHMDHGIGKFGGLIKTGINGRPQEMIKIIYQGNALALVSIHALHKLSKYRGKDGIPPRISKLGGGAWLKLKEKTKTKMKEMARELISLYARRRTEKGHAFAPDSYLQHELEASFIYEETPDQLKTMQAVKEDMESERPMDRLVCGDVGFGKTEIAIRAAFKAAADGKQVAVLVPTTVLAMQHYNTFVNRLGDLPVRVEFLSRAKKPKEVKQILEDLEAGKIDILVGTHKIIGKSVKFKDLGLLIIFLLYTTPSQR
ncbi:MAG: DEAD/DEAH box helicase, partial [Muribaculaceae bacterium]|nr:DEAD/DEAH box helicase [Muribaculaceae bacterium]